MWEWVNQVVPGKAQPEILAEEIAGRHSKKEGKSPHLFYEAAISKVGTPTKVKGWGDTNETPESSERGGGEGGLKHSRYA